MESLKNNKMEELQVLINQLQKLNSKNPAANSIVLQLKEKIEALSEQLASHSMTALGDTPTISYRDEEIKRLNSHGFNSTFVKNSKSNLVLLQIDAVKSFIQNVKLGGIASAQKAFPNIFYSSYYGYRFNCRIDFYRDKINLYLNLTTGKYDALLSWPFNFDIELVLLNQVDEAKSKVVSLKPDVTAINQWQRPMATTLSGFVTWDSITLSEIIGESDDVSEYLRNDTLYFVVKVLQSENTSCSIRCNLDTEFDSTNLLKEFKTHNFNDLSVIQARSNMFIFTVGGVAAILKSLNSGATSVNNQSSLQFYSSQVGYRMQCLLTIDREYVKVRVIIIQGQNDEMLFWPFQKRIRLVLMNQVERCDDRVLIVNTKSAPRPINATQQMFVYCKDRDACDINILSTKELDQYEGISDFLRNDRMHIQVKVIDE